MKNSGPIVIIVILLTISIQKSNSQTNRISPKNVPFYAEFIDEVPELKVPIEFTCGIDQLSLTEDQREKLRPFTPAGYEIIGKLSINTNFNILICGELIGDKYVPYLFVTDKNGLGDSYQKLLEDTCTSASINNFKFTISTISSNQIVVIKKMVNTGTMESIDHEVKTIFEINKKGSIKKK